MYVCNDYSKLRIQSRHLQSEILNFSKNCFWDSWSFVNCRFDSHFAFIAKEEINFSLIFSFYYCLVKECWALKVAEQFSMRGLVAYKQATACFLHQ